MINTSEVHPTNFPWTASAFTDLLLRPERFFRVLLDHKLASFPFLVIWIQGMAATVDRINSRQIIHQLSMTTGSLQGLLTNWAALWGSVIFGGLLAGLLIWVIGGLFYRIRLRFCGVRGVDPGVARRVYIYAQFVWAAPLMIWLALVTLTYPDYQAANAEAPLAWSLSATLFWSIWVSYRGAVGCFPVARGRARFWFLILPMSFYLLIFAGVMLAFIAAMF